jgi:hypothetical protein
MTAIPAYTPNFPNLAPSINPNPWSPIKSGHAVFSDVDGLDKVFKCAKSAIDFLSALTPSVPAYLPILGSLVKGAGEVLTPFQFFKVAKEWTEINKKNWAGKASLVGITAVATIGIGRFLEKIQLFNMTAAVSKLGTVPVLGTIVQLPFGALTAGVAAFNVVDAGIKLRKENQPLGRADVARTKLQKWNARQQVVANFNKGTFDLSGITSNWTSLGVGYSKKANAVSAEVNAAAVAAIAGAVDEATATTAATSAKNAVNLAADTARTTLINRKTTLLLQSHPTASYNDNDADAVDAVNAYTAYKVRHWRTEFDNSKTESKKAVFTLASEVSKFALIVLGLIGASFSVAALAASSLPMLTLGLIVAGIAIAKKVYDTRHKESYVMVHPDNFESAVVSKYRELKKQIPPAPTGLGTATA